MTLLLLLVSPTIHAPDNAACPFCPGKKEKDWETYPGEANDSVILRAVMKNPPSLSEKQSNVRRKDGQDGRQGADSPRPTYDTQKQGEIFVAPRIGAYSNEAHHAISGKQIMNNEPIEHLIDMDHGKIKKDTGYSVNNCANGVCLPSYPRSFRTRPAPRTPWSMVRRKRQYSIMRLPMQAGKGQAHIGEHDIEVDHKEPQIHRENYPKKAKKKLQALYDVTMKRWLPECPWCWDGDEQKDPLPPPFRINGYLDDVSLELIAHITRAPEDWEYFISKFAKCYHYELCKHPKTRPQARAAQAGCAEYR